MLKPLNANLSPRQETQPEVSVQDLLSLFEGIFRDDIRFRIILILSKREGACLREIARNAGISHKNLSKYLETLTQKGIVEAYPIGIRKNVYKLSNKYDYLHHLLR